MMKNAVFPLLSAEKSMLSSDIRFLQKSDSKTDSLLLRERRMVSFTCAGVESEKILYSFFAVHEKLISPIFSNRLSISASLFSACSGAAFKNSATCRKRFPAEFQSAKVHNTHCFKQCSQKMFFNVCPKGMFFIFICNYIIKCIYGET